MNRSIALIGDYSEKVVAHRAIPRALELAASGPGTTLAWHWIMSRDLADPERQLAGFSAVWVVPASPYQNPDGVLAAIRWARESRRPFLGTCGGFQHALVEFARNVAGLPEAGHAESCPTGAVLVVSRLNRAIMDAKAEVRLAPGSRIRAAYGMEHANEGYHCRYGLNAAYAATLERAGIGYTAWDDAGEVRAAELPNHPFFVGTLFQPERAALEGRTPPLVRAFAHAAAQFPA